ncbi:hypothetical protein D3C72_1225770 [compost metagenome]
MRGLESEARTLRLRWLLAVRHRRTCRRALPHRHARRHRHAHGRRAAARIARAAHEALEVDFGHHALRDQEGVGAFVGLHDHVRQGLLHRALHAAPGLAAQAGGQPLFHQQLGQGLGLEHVPGIELVRAFEVLDAQAQVAEFEAGLVVDGLREARGEDVALDHLVADELQPQRRGGRRGAARRARAQRLAPAGLRQRHPLRGMALERHEVVAAFLHGARAADIGGHRGQPVADGLGQRSDRTFRGRHETLTRLACELQGRSGPRSAH